MNFIWNEATNSFDLCVSATTDPDIKQIYTQAEVFELLSKCVDGKVLKNINGSPEVVSKYTTTEGAAIQKAKRLAELKAHLNTTLSQAIAYAAGEMSEEDYAPVKANRVAWQNELRALESKAE